LDEWNGGCAEQHEGGEEDCTASYALGHRAQPSLPTYTDSAYLSPPNLRVVTTKVFFLTTQFLQFADDSLKLGEGAALVFDSEVNIHSECDGKCYQKCKEHGVVIV
jgi:hypothetical protein